MLKMKTIYPYGLNTNFLHQNVAHTKTTCIYNILHFYVTSFPDNKINLNRKKRGLKKTKKKFFDFLQIINCLENLFCKTDMIKKIKTTIFSLKNSVLKAFNRFLQSYTFQHSLIKDIVLDLMKFKLKVENLDLICKVNKKLYLIFHYSHKVLDRFHLNKMLNNSFVTGKLPVHKSLVPTFISSFKYDLSIGRRIFNYNRIHDLTDMHNIKCHCALYPNYIDSAHGHVITSDTSLLQDDYLDNLLKKGTKFRPIPRYSRKTVLNKFILDLDRAIHRMSQIFELPYFTFYGWRHAVLNSFQHMLPKYSSQKTDNHFLNISTLKDQFLITYVDKSPSTFVFICKKYYIQLIQEHLENESNYKVTRFSTEQLISSHKKIVGKFLKCTLNNAYDLDNKIKIPNIYLVPKLHKNPIKFRPITNATASVLKPLEIMLASAMDMLLSRIQTKYPHNFVIKDNKPILQFLNNNASLKEVSTFDFTSLFTSIPLQDLYNKIVAFIDEFFTEEDISIKTKIGTFKMKNVYIKKILHFCLFNNFISWQFKNYKQTKGIPMGANYAPSLANIYLLAYEIAFFNIHPDILLNAFRYIDDIIVFDFPMFCNFLKIIYPRFLEITASNNNCQEASFLDLLINISNHSVNVYDKRKALNIPVRVIHFHNNVSFQVIKNTFTAHILRVARICSEKGFFLNNVKEIIKAFTDNEFPTWLASKQVKIFFKKYPVFYTKFSITQDDLSNL